MANEQMPTSKNSGVLAKLNEHKWSLLAGGILLAMILGARGGLAAMLPVLRLALPLIVLYLIYRWFKRKLLDSVGAKIRAQVEKGMGMSMDDMMKQAAEKSAGKDSKRSGDNVIDLCADCGKPVASRSCPSCR